MPKMTKSPSQLARVAYDNAKQALALFSHPKSPKKYTQPELRAILELTVLPDHSTLCKAEQRLLKKTPDFYHSYLNSLPLRRGWKFPPAENDREWLP